MRSFFEQCLCFLVFFSLTLMICASQGQSQEPTQPPAVEQPAGLPEPASVLVATPVVPASLAEQPKVENQAAFAETVRSEIQAVAIESKPGQETPSLSTNSKPLIDFERDVVSLFQSRCMHCHSALDKKGGFNIEDRDSVLGYIEPGKPSSSAIWTDYLTCDPSEPKSLVMPPKSNGGPLSGSELATIKTWIEEGANWPEGARVGKDTPIKQPKEIEAKSIVQRLWVFQGFFHPATVHFPIALISVGALAAILSWFTGKRAEDFALSCLVLGSISSVVVACMGWSFAITQGYPDWNAGSGSDSTFFWHRWLGVTLAIASCIVSAVALSAKRGQHPGRTRFWKWGLIFLAAMVGWVGHQGGELKYGEELYENAFKVLRGS